MSEAPNRISGGFNMSQTLYSVSKKGVLTRIAGASDCTYEGDRKVVIAVDKTIPRIAIRTVRHGNDGWEKLSYYK
jgi:predicted regulator of amino acid metabolism with ACT domain